MIGKYFFWSGWVPARSYIVTHSPLYNNVRAREISIIFYKQKLIYFMFNLIRNLNKRRGKMRIDLEIFN